MVDQNSETLMSVEYSQVRGGASCLRILLSSLFRFSRNFRYSETQSEKSHIERKISRKSSRAISPKKWREEEVVVGGGVETWKETWDHP